MERVRIPPHTNRFARISDTKHKQATDGVGESANRSSHSGEVASAPLEFRLRAFALSYSLIDRRPVHFQ